MAKRKPKIEEDSDYEEDFYDDITEKEKLVDDSLDNFDTGWSNNAQVQQIWLDTEPYLNNIYLSLTNQQIKRLTDKYSKEKIELEQIPGTEPLANKKGISQIMARLRSIVSKDIVQGNLTPDLYHSIMKEFKIKTKREILVNRIKWNINIDDIETIYDIITNSITIYLTRTLHNLERERDKSKGSEYKDSKKGFFDKFTSSIKKNSGNRYQ